MSKETFFKKYFKNSVQVQHFKVRVANFEPLYLRHFWVKYNVSVLIRLEISLIFQNSPNFHLQLIFKGLQEPLNINQRFFGTPCITNIINSTFSLCSLKKKRKIISVGISTNNFLILQGTVGLARHHKFCAKKRKYDERFK